MHRQHQEWNMFHQVSTNYKIMNYLTFQVSIFNNAPTHRQECSSMGGTEDGTCAEGFGVCCLSKSHFLNHSDKIVLCDLLYHIIYCVSGVMGCNSDSSSQNITFIEQTSISDPSSFTARCQYTICPCSSGMWSTRNIY